MSYILDALKKSEEERHQGQVPNLGSNSALIHNPKRKSSFLPWVIAVLLVVNVFFVGFWVLKEPKAIQSSEESLIVAEDNDGLHGSNTESLAVESIPQGTTHKDQEKIAESQVTEDLNAADSVIKDKQVNYQYEAVSDSRISEPLADEQYQPEPISTHQDTAAKQVAQPALIVPEGRYQSADNYETSVVEATEEPPLLITPKGKSRPYTGPAYTSTVAEEIRTTQANEAGAYNETSRQPDQVATESMASIQRLTDKPHSFQIQVPDMAFNSHIYTDTPSSRRVMINNIYLREGQTFSGMKVEHITEEGIVLSLKNEPFKMGVLRDWYSPR